MLIAMTNLGNKTFSNRQLVTRVYMKLIIVNFNVLHSALYNYHAGSVCIQYSL
jgi:hypothetical protein